jgi:hypothetical protein
MHTGFSLPLGWRGSTAGCGGALDGFAIDGAGSLISQLHWIGSWLLDCPSREISKALQAERDKGKGEMVTYPEELP